MVCCENSCRKCRSCLQRRKAIVSIQLLFLLAPFMTQAEQIIHFNRASKQTRFRRNTPCTPRTKSLFPLHPAFPSGPTPHFSFLARTGGLKQRESLPTAGPWLGPPSPPSARRGPEGLLPQRPSRARQADPRPLLGPAGGSTAPHTAPPDTP